MGFLAHHPSIPQSILSWVNPTVVSVQTSLLKSSHFRFNSMKQRNRWGIVRGRWRRGLPFSHVLLSLRWLHLWRVSRSATINSKRLLHFVQWMESRKWKKKKEERQKILPPLIFGGSATVTFCCIGERERDEWSCVLCYICPQELGFYNIGLKTGPPNRVHHLLPVQLMKRERERERNQLSP